MKQCHGGSEESGLGKKEKEKKRIAPPLWKTRGMWAGAKTEALKVER